LAWKKWLSWQIGSRLVPGPVLMPFVNNTKLLVHPGLWGATMNIYTGLAEFYDMSFILHFLRPTDIFVDVGANVGVYTVLSSGVVGCKTIAFEPGVKAGKVLLSNCNINQIADLVEYHPYAVGDKSEKVKFTKGLDTVNHVVGMQTNIPSEQYVEVEMVTLESIVSCRKPVLIKIDVEGFTSPVLKGGEELFKESSLQAVIIEVIIENVNDHDPEADPLEVFRRMTEFGLYPYQYDPFTRQLTAIPEQNWIAPKRNQPALEYNFIFIRDAEAAGKRVAEAAKFKVWDYEI
jgi:FkbM family methyltransferase